MAMEAREGGSVIDEGAAQGGDGRLMKLSRVAYQRFKEVLFAQQIATGATLTQGELCALLDVPIGPLREALQLLESERLVEMLPRAGIRIVKPDVSVIRNSFQARRILEAEAVRKFAERAPIEDIEDWTRRHREMLARALESGIAEGLIDEARALDLTFHASLVASLRNPLIDEFYARTKDQIRLIRLDNSYLLSAATVAATMREHLRVLEPLLKRDAEAAVLAMEDHLAAALNRSIGL